MYGAQPSPLFVTRSFLIRKIILNKHFTNIYLHTRVPIYKLSVAKSCRKVNFPKILSSNTFYSRNCISLYYGTFSPSLLLFTSYRRFRRKFYKKLHSFVDYAAFSNCYSRLLLSSGKIVESPERVLEGRVEAIDRFAGLSSSTELRKQGTRFDR